MGKIPVGKTIAYAYGFLFHHIGTVVGLTLIPALLYAAADYVNHSYAAAYQAQVQAGDAQAIGLYLLLSLLTLLVILFSSSVAAVAVTEEALGLRGAKPFVSFRVGRAEWRMFLANLRYFLGAIVLIGLAILVSVIAFLLAGVSLQPGAAPPKLSIAVVLATVLSAAVFAYAFVSLLRMTFLLPPSVVAEEKGGLKRSHELTKGNFWRIFAIVLALSLPIMMLAVAGELAILRAFVGPDLFNQDTIDNLPARIDEALKNRLLPWEVFVSILFIFIFGLLYSASAFAYRALVPGSLPATPERPV